MKDGKPSGRLPTKSDKDTYYLAGVGEFELEDPILCSRPLHFNDSKDSFVAFETEKAHKEDPFGYKTCVVDKITFVPQIHTTHAETDQHVKKGETTITVCTNEYLKPFPSIALELNLIDGELEVQVD